MKKILGERSGIGAEHISRQDILMVLLPLVYKYLKDNESKFCQFLENLFPDNRWKVGGKDDEDVDSFCVAMIRNCLSVLRNVQVLDGDKVLLELDEPDEKILPFSEEKLDEIRRGTSKTYPMEQQKEE